MKISEAFILKNIEFSMMGLTLPPNLAKIMGKKAHEVKMSVCLAHYALKLY